MALSLVSLNIERHKHYERFLPFLLEQKPDIVCFQELLERDIPRITEALGGEVQFAPEFIYGDLDGSPVEGIGIWSQLSFSNVRAIRYGGKEEDAEIGVFREKLVETGTMYEERWLKLLSVEVEKEGATYQIATTHFTWTKEGVSTSLQREDAGRLIGVLDTLGEFVVCGDFNAPRGLGTFELFAERYKDTIPLEYKTSLDISLHRAGKTEGHHLEKLMVDCLFTTPGYVASDVRLQFGVSDHAAIVATIEKAP